MPHKIAPAAMLSTTRRRWRQTMAPPLTAARIGNGLETLLQLAHLFGIEHDLRGSSQLQSISVGVR